MHPVGVDDEGDVLPGLRSSLKAWAANISAHWERGSPGRAARPAAALTPGDHMAMAKRQCLHRRHLGHPQQHVEQIGASSSQGQGQMRSTHGQPWPDNAAWPLEPDEPLADHPGQGEKPHAPMPMQSEASGAAAGSTGAPTDTPAAPSSATDAPAVAAPEGECSSGEESPYRPPEGYF